MLLRWLYTIPLRLRSLLRRSQVERDLDDELRFHLEQQIEREIAGGTPPQEARCAALRRLDGLEQRKEECRDMRQMNLFDNLSRDLSYAVRMLARNPGFTMTALLALALGIGANTAMYSIVHRVMLRPLDVREPHQLVRVYESNPSLNRLTWSASLRNYLSWKQQARGLELTAFQGFTASWMRDGETERLEGLAVTSSFLTVLSVTIVRGAGFVKKRSESAGIAPLF